MTGAEAAEQMLFDNCIYDVDVILLYGNPNNYYNPQNEQIFLEEAIYSGADIKAWAIATHEAGHAIQHQRGSIWLLLRFIFNSKWLRIKNEQDASNKALKWLKSQLSNTDLILVEKQLQSCLETYKK